MKSEDRGAEGTRSRESQQRTGEQKQSREQRNRQDDDRKSNQKSSGGASEGRDGGRADQRQPRGAKSEQSTKAGETSTSPSSKGAAAGQSSGVKPGADRADDRGTAAGGASTGNGQGADAKRAGSNEAARVRLSDQQRTVVRERLFAQQRPQRRSTNVNVRVVVGAPVPRGLSLAVLPPVIIEEVPEFRGYRYGWVRDEIVIVDPGTNRVVEVFERGGERARNAGSGGGARELQLSEAEQRLVYDALINEFDPVDNVRVRLGLGVSIPRNVELDRFPRRLVEQIAALKEHRFVIVDREVVIVDPRNREIVLLVDDR